MTIRITGHRTRMSLFYIRFQGYVFPFAKPSNLSLSIGCNGQPDRWISALQELFHAFYEWPGKIVHRCDDRFSFGQLVDKLLPPTFESVKIFFRCCSIIIRNDAKKRDGVFIFKPTYRGFMGWAVFCYDGVGAKQSFCDFLTTFDEGE